MQNKIGYKRLTVIALLSALICICSLIQIPTSVLPVTMQLFAIYFCLFCFGGAVGFFSTLCYVCLGLIGLPVFSGLKGGIWCIFDTGGGFIIGFVLLTLVYWAFTFKHNHKAVKIAASIFSLVVLYLCGVLWYGFVYLDGNVLESFLSVALPFILPDIIKIFLAYILSSRLKKYIKI